jgi:hypothetical protein
LESLPIADCRLPIGRMMQVEQRNELNRMSMKGVLLSINNQQSTINNQQSNQQSAIGNRQ